MKQEFDLVKYLKKPYDPETLLRAVDSAFDFFFRDRSPVISMGGIVYKEVETKHELEEAFRITYEVYVAELNRFRPEKLTSEQRIRGQKYDEYDFRADTRQIVALKDGKAVGRVRIIYNDLPIEKDFSIPSKFIKGNTKTEISKFMIERKHRGTGSYLGLLRFIYHHLKECDDVYISNLPKLDKFYKKMGFRKIGSFENSELDDIYSALYIFMPDFLHRPESLKRIGLSSLLRKLIMVPIPKNELEDFYLQEKSKAIALAHKSGVSGEY